MKRSNITLNSNIYPVKGLINTDREFLKHVEGKAALKIIDLHSDYRQGRDFTKAQSHQWNYETKCFHNEDGDYTWGLTLKNGELQNTCRCLNLSCKSFKSCRPDFDEEELEYLIPNIEKENIEINSQQNFREIDIPMPRSYREKIGRENENIDETKESRQNLIENKELQKEKANRNAVGGVAGIWNKLTGNLKQSKQIGKEKEKQEQRLDNKPDALQESTGRAKDNRTKGKMNIVDQKYVIEASEDTKLLVNAGPGTGKTYALIERLKYLTDECGLIPAQEMLVLCFSKAAIAEIKKRIEQAIENEEANDDLRFLDIRTFDSFATYLITQLDEDADLTGKSYEERIKDASNRIDNENGIFNGLKHFIVDEIQDLVGERAKLVQSILKASSCGFTLLGDSCQSIYDYQIEDGEAEIDSVKFYKWIEEHYGQEIKKVEFEGNHRQTELLHNMAGKIRTSILMEEGTKEKIQKIADTLRGIDSLGKCSELSPGIIGNTPTTCFLCRNNGEVLKLSQELRNLDISHSIQRPATSKLVKPWLGIVFGEYEKDTIDCSEFGDIFSKNYPQAQLDEIKKEWNTLKNLEGSDKSRLTIKNILENIFMEKSLINDLFIIDKSNTVVSTIHRAKGREYERVILLEDSFERLLNNPNETNIDEEAKTFYVAITRPKQDINITKFNRKTYLRPVKGNESRWLETNRYHKKKFTSISGFEVGKENDISKSSFIDLDIFDFEKKVYDNQQYIRKNIKKGDGIILKKADCTDRVQDTIYLIYHDNRAIGSMSAHFTYQLIEALKQINNLTYIQKLPLEIHESYVDEIVTYTLKNTNTRVPSIYKKTHMWTGISLVGFGRLKWNESDL